MNARKIKCDLHTMPFHVALKVHKPPCTLPPPPGAAGGNMQCRNLPCLECESVSGAAAANKRVIVICFQLTAPHAASRSLQAYLPCSENKKITISIIRKHRHILYSCYVSNFFPILWTSLKGAAKRVRRLMALELEQNIASGLVLVN